MENHEVQSHSEELAESKFWRPLSEVVVSPFSVLGFFLLINVLTYFDRGAIASVLGHIQDDPIITGPFNPLIYGGLGHGNLPYVENAAVPLTDTQLGTLGSGFMVGFMVFCPCFASLSALFTPMKVVALGLIGWTLAAVCTGLASNYSMLLLARILVGIGEASFVGLAPTTLDNLAPAASRTLWLAVFYSAIPAGQALGIALGGVFSDFVHVSAFPRFGGWRFVFLFEAALMFPLALFCLMIPPSYDHKQPEDTACGGSSAALPPERRAEDLADSPIQGEAEAEAEAEATERLRESEPFLSIPIIDNYTSSEEPLGLLAAGVILLHNGVYVLACLGYALYTAVVGAIAFWIPRYLEVVLRIPSSEGSVAFGIISVVTGITGTMFGGAIVDRFGSQSDGSRVFMGFAYMTFVTAFALPLGILCIVVRSAGLFFALVALTEFLLFSTQAPMNASLLRIVSTTMRTYAMSFSVLVIHLLGDFPSPILVGYLADHRFQGNLQPCLLVIFLLLVPCVLCWGAAWRSTRKAWEVQQQLLQQQQHLRQRDPSQHSEASVSMAP